MFGGSFNPVHNGHIMLAQAFTEKLDLDKILIVPSYISPHKAGDSTVTPLQRLEMCRAAFSDIRKAEVSDIEIKRKGQSYTYLTLEELSVIYSGAELFLITGADMFMTIDKWKNPELIFRKAVICGVPRNEDNIEALEKQAEQLRSLGARTEILDAGIVTVSSTMIREMVRTGKDISRLVPEAVAAYIKKNRLYTDILPDTSTGA